MPAAALRLAVAIASLVLVVAVAWLVVDLSSDPDDSSEPIARIPESDRATATPIPATSTPAPTPSPTAPPPTPIPTPTPDPDTVRTCESSDLRVVFTDQQGVMGGGRGSAIGFVNESSSLCNLEGLPDVSLVEEAGDRYDVTPRLLPDIDQPCVERTYHCVDTTLLLPPVEPDRTLLPPFVRREQPVGILGVSWRAHDGAGFCEPSPPDTRYTVIEWSDSIRVRADGGPRPCQGDMYWSTYRLAPSDPRFP